MRAAIFIYASIPVFLFGCAGPGSPPGSYLQTYGSRRSHGVHPLTSAAALVAQKQAEGCSAMRNGRRCGCCSRPNRPTPGKNVPEPPAPWVAREVVRSGEGAMCDAAANEPLSPFDEFRRERARSIRAMDLGRGGLSPSLCAICHAMRSDLRVPLSSTA